MKVAGLRPRQCQKRQSGWTLTEALLVVAIVGVIATIGVPSWVQTFNSVRLSTLANGLMAELNLARAEAIRRGRRVALCAAVEPDVCASTPGWEQGSIMFEDANNNGLRDAAEPVIRVRPAAPNGWTIRGNGPVARYVSYHPLGGTLLVSGAFQAGTITVCRASAQNASGTEIVINSVGRPRSQRVTLTRCG